MWLQTRAEKGLAGQMRFDPRLCRACPGGVGTSQGGHAIHGDPSIQPAPPRLGLRTNSSGVPRPRSRNCPWALLPLALNLSWDQSPLHVPVSWEPGWRTRLSQHAWPGDHSMPGPGLQTSGPFLELSTLPGTPAGTCHLPPRSGGPREGGGARRVVFCWNNPTTSGYKQHPLVLGISSPEVWPWQDCYF